MEAVECGRFASRLAQDTLLRATQGHTDRPGEPFCPEVGRHPPGPGRDFAFVARIDREGDEAQTGMADREVIDVEVKFGGECVSGGTGHHATNGSSLHVTCLSQVCVEPTRLSLGRGRLELVRALPRKQSRD